MQKWDDKKIELPDFLTAYEVDLQVGELPASTAASVVVKGLVRDEQTRDPIVGASVQVVDETKGATTNALGRFTIELAPGDHQLLVGYIGYRETAVKLQVNQAGEVEIPLQVTAYYELRNVKGETGRTYTLNIKLANGEAYQSHPQIMPEPISLDTAEVKAEWYYTNTTAGAIVRAPFAFVYARTTAPAVTKDRFLHWESEAIYLFDEIFKFYEIFPVSHQCFINNRINDQVVALSDLSKYSPGGVVYENVGKRKIDQAFEKKIAFAVYQRAINREAYEYWNKISKLLEANGTIFDAPPAAVPGNVENTTHPDLPALGFFEVGAADTVRVFTGNGQLGSEFLLQNTPYCQLDYSKGWPPVNHPECDDCLTWIKGAYYEIPWWWQ